MVDRVDLQELDRDAAGDLTVTQSFLQVKAFVEYNNTRTYDASGQVVMAKALAFVHSEAAGLSAALDAEHAKWRLVDGLRTMDVLSISPVRDPRTGDLHHYEMVLL